MIEQEDWDKIRSLIDEMVEKGKQDVMLLLPEVSANLYMRTVAKMKALDKFRGEYKELVPHLDIVRFEMEKVEGDNPGKTYDEILKLALPEISSKVKQIGKMDVSTVQKPTDLKMKGDLGVL
jgi:hypothetical protein